MRKQKTWQKFKKGESSRPSNRRGAGWEDPDERKQKRFYNKKSNNLAVVFNEDELREHHQGMFMKNVIRKKRAKAYAIKMEKKML